MQINTNGFPFIEGLSDYVYKSLKCPTSLAEYEAQLLELKAVVADIELQERELELKHYLGAITAKALAEQKLLAVKKLRVTKKQILLLQRWYQEGFSHNVQPAVTAKLQIIEGRLNILQKALLALHKQRK